MVETNNTEAASMLLADGYSTVLTQRKRPTQNVSLDPEIHEKLVSEAAQRSLTVSALLNEILANYYLK